MSANERAEAKADVNVATGSPETAGVTALVAAKLRCVAPMVAVYATAYLGLSILSGFARPFFGAKVVGPINIGFVLIALNYLIAWIVAIVYAQVAKRIHDPLVEKIVAGIRGGAKG